jgi:hypothetical protein
VHRYHECRIPAFVTDLYCSRRTKFPFTQRCNSSYKAG